MRSLHIAPLQAAMVFALGILIGGGVLTGFAPRMQPVADPVVTDGVKSECNSGDAVADFVCRNTWLANTRHSYR